MLLRGDICRVGRPRQELFTLGSSSAHCVQSGEEKIRSPLYYVPCVPAGPVLGKAGDLPAAGINVLPLFKFIRNLRSVAAYSSACNLCDSIAVAQKTAMSMGNQSHINIINGSTMPPPPQCGVEHIQYPGTTAEKCGMGICG